MIIVGVKLAIHIGCMEQLKLDKIAYLIYCTIHRKAQQLKG